jgi:hypothetical protein
VAVSAGGSLPLQAELARADVVITAMSTAGLEALAIGRPVVVYLARSPLVCVTLPLARTRICPSPAASSSWPRCCRR